MSKSIGKKRYRLYYNLGQRYCKGPCRRLLAYDETTIDHILPKSKGGGNAYANLQIMCSYCNEAKADNVPIGFEAC